jgi:SAM-dependent methyltransferase
MRARHRCRFCGEPLRHVVVDLGASPLANSYLSEEELDRPESFYPLCLYVCGECWLAQVPTVESGEAIFSDYAYFSSYSDSWLEHARRYVEATSERFGLDENSFVVEVASNDGYLLQWFVERGVPALGVEPAANVAEAAREKGIPTHNAFFSEQLGRELAIEHGKADLVVANNVFAHVPDLNDFTAGFTHLLAEGGVLTIEVQHLLRLLDEVQFDTVYHEHFSYYSLSSARRVLAAHGLTVFDVEELPTHGGSLRIYARHTEDASHPIADRVAELLERERAAGLEGVEAYSDFGERVRAVKRSLLRFLIDARERSERVVAYGAPAKGNTLLNYCGVGTDLIDFTVDRSPHKQGHFLPGTRIPIEGPERIFDSRPAWVLILPWNLRDEIARQMAGIAEWGGRFVVAIPEVESFDPPADA